MLDEIESIENFMVQYWTLALLMTIAGIVFVKKFRKPGSPSINISLNLSSSGTASKLDRFARPQTAVKTTSLHFTSEDQCFEAVMQALQRRDKISAIKLVREAKGLSLVDAKHLVEALDQVKSTVGVSSQR